jgi:hypothetical protein
VTHRRADARQFVSGDGCANAAAADEHPAVRSAAENKLTHRFGIVRVIHRIGVHAPDIGDVVAQLPHVITKFLLERESGVIRADNNAHRIISPIELTPASRRCPR